MKFLEKQNSFAYRLVDFIGRSNIFIALCAASLTAWSQKLFLGRFSVSFIYTTFAATFLLYNAQRMYLSFFQNRPYSIKYWDYKNKYLLLVIMVLLSIGFYPFGEISKQNLLTYFVSFCLGIFYFLPFSNLRTIPVVKSFTVGAVWVLVCVVAPLEGCPWGSSKVFFCLTQLFLISALCVLFNIRDMEEDRRSKTHSVPVLFGIKKTRVFNYVILLFYLFLAPYVQLSLWFFAVYFVTFALSCLFTQKASIDNHPFYYTYGVDGVILLQSLLGLFFIQN